MDYQIRANYNIGGSAPLGLPREIRKIESYNPTLALGLEANATKWSLTRSPMGSSYRSSCNKSKGMRTKAEGKELSYRNKTR